MAKKRKAGDGLIRQRADGRWGGGTLSAKLPDILREDGYSDVQAFMATYREAEAIVEQYNRDLASWEHQVKQKSRPPSPPERQSVRNRLRQLQEEGKQNSQLKQRKKSQDRDR